MKVPLKWLEDFVKVKLDLKDLMWKMTEVGLTTEAYEKVGKDIVLDVEVTPNRPDWLSIVGVAREVGAIQNRNIKYPKIVNIPKKTADLQIDISINHKLCSRYTAITIKGVTVKDSPQWMQDYLKLVGLRPINNLVDITNFVMFELGVPIHVFDYDKFDSKNLKMQLSRGGEKFESVDKLEYELPEDVIIIKDKEKVVDLCGIKGGNNSSIDESTKNIYIHVPVYTPQIIRKTSQKLKLSSDASYIYERGADAGRTLETLKRVVNLTLDQAGGEIASDVIDIKQKDFVANRLILKKAELERILGIEVDNRKVIKLLKHLDFRPESRGGSIVCTVPTFRKDVQIPEDLVEEVARMYGYNQFPKTLPATKFNTTKIPYSYDFVFERKLKNILTSAGYHEVNTLSLISEQMIKDSLLPLDSHIKLSNPVSREYEYLRISLVLSLIIALKTNVNTNNVRLFEYSKTFLGPVDTREERYMLAGVTNVQDFREAKGMVDFIINKLNIENVSIKSTKVEKGIWHPNKSAVLENNNGIIGTYGYINPKVIHNYGLDSELFGFEFDVDTLKKMSRQSTFTPISKYPSHFEDITIEKNHETKMADVIESIRKTSNIIKSIELVEIFNNKFTLRIEYHHKGKTLTDNDVGRLRKKILKTLKKMQLKVDE